MQQLLCGLVSTRAGLILAALIPALAGCSASSSTGLGGTPLSGTGGSSGILFGTGGNGSGDAPGSGSFTGFGGEVTTIPTSIDAGSCGYGVGAEQIPVDVYMMIDQSLSMTASDPSGGTRWSGIVSAITQFVQSPQSAGIGVGVQYFGLGGLFASCTPADYANPEVEIAPLPGNAANIVTSLGNHGPSSTTPSEPALQGAINHAIAWKGSHPGHTVVVLLVTDGEPDTCDTGTVAGVASIAASGVSGTPSIPTYVLGVGPSLTDLNTVAAAGGTGQAYVVSSASGVGDAVVAQLNKIRGSAVNPCEFTIPTPAAGQTFNYSQVNVIYSSADGQSQYIYNTPDVSKCDPTDLAWYYDNPTAPTKITLCDATCQTVTQGGGSVNYQLGCPTKPVPIH